MHVCMHKHPSMQGDATLGGSRGSPRKFLGIRWSEINSEAILGQK